MGPDTKVLLFENVRSADPKALEMIRNKKIMNSNGQPSETDDNGAVPDVIGPVSGSKAQVQTWQSGPAFKYEINQRITVSMPNAAGKYQGVLAMDNIITLTNNSVSITFGEIKHFPK
jgi:hypothetical protein